MAAIGGGAALRPERRSSGGGSSGARGPGPLLPPSVGLPRPEWLPCGGLWDRLGLIEISIGVLDGRLAGSSPTRFPAMPCLPPARACLNE